MIETLGASGPRPMPQTTKTPMTADQSSQITEVLGQYDAANLSAQDARAIVAAVGELGIQPGSGLAQVMRDAGFVARDVAKLAGIDGPGGPRGPGDAPAGEGPRGPFQAPGRDPVDPAIVSLVSDVAESFRASDKSVSFMDMLASAKAEAGLAADAPLVDYYA